MPLILTDEQQMLAESAKGFLDEHAPVAALRKLRDERSPDGYSKELWAKFAEMGWTGMVIPEKHGGLDFGYVGAGLICEAMGRNLTASPFLSTAIMAATALKRGGSEAQQGKWLPAIAAGKALMTVAVDEGRKHNPAGTAMTAEKQGNGFKLTGTKTFVADGHVADALIVAARTGGSAGERAGISLFIVDRKAKGLAIERTIMVDSRNAARLTFDGVMVDGADALGAIDDGYKLLEATLDAGRIGLSAELSGLSQEIFDRTVQYLKDRGQFGKPIGSFQAVKHPIVNMMVGIDMVRSLVYDAACACDHTPQRALVAARMAKAKASDVAQFCSGRSVQLHGGIGFTWECDVHLFFKRNQHNQFLFGDGAHHRTKLAEVLVGPLGG